MASLFDELTSAHRVDVSPAEFTKVPDVTEHELCQDDITIFWEVWIETTESCDGPSPLGGPFQVKHDHLYVPLTQWRVPVCIDATGRHVFFEVPTSISYQHPAPIVSLRVDSQGRRLSSRPTPRLLGALERSSGNHFHQSVAASSDSDSDTPSISRNPLSHKSNPPSMQHSLGQKNPSTNNTRRSSFSFLSTIDISSFSDAPKGHTIKQLVSMSNDIGDDMDIETFCLTEGSGQVFGWIGAPSSTSSLIPPNWSLSIPPQIQKISCGGSHVAFLTLLGEVWGLGDSSYDQFGEVKTHQDIPELLTQIEEPVKDVACGSQHTVIVLKSNRILQMGKDIPSEVILQETLQNWIPQFLGAGDQFNAIVLQQPKSSEQKLLTWGWNISDNRLGRPASPHTSATPTDFIIDEIRNLSIIQLCVVGCGGALLCSSGESKKSQICDCRSRQSQLWLWGNVAEYQPLNYINGVVGESIKKDNSGKDSTYLHRWREPWENGGMVKKNGKHQLKEQDETGRKIEIVSICLSPRGLGVITIVWTGLKAASGIEKETAKIPKLNLAPIAAERAILEATSGSADRADTATVAPAASSAVSEFWKRWGAEESMATPTPVNALKQLVEKQTEKISSTNASTEFPKPLSQTSLDWLRSSSSRELSRSQIAPKWKLTPGTVVSTVQDVPKSESLLKKLSTQHKDIRTPPRSRHAFTTLVPPTKRTTAMTLSTESGGQQNQIWSAWNAIGSMKAISVMKDALNDIAKDVREEEVTTLVPIGSASKTGRSFLADEEFEEKAFVTDEYSILPKLIGPDWKIDPLKSVKGLVINFEKFRRSVSGFWQNFLLRAEYNITPPDKQEIQSIGELHTAFVAMKEKIINHFGLAKSKIFGIYELPELTHSNIIRNGTKGLKAPRGWSALRRALVSQWIRSGSECLNVRAQRRPKMIEEVSCTGSEHSRGSKKSDGDIANDPDSRIKRLRVESFIKAGGECSPDSSDIPAQSWELLPTNISVIDSFPCTSLLPPTSLNRVYIGLYAGCLVGLKITPVDGSSDDEVKRRLYEIFMHQQLRHPNILLFIGAIIRGPQIVLVTELATRGTLWNALHESHFGIPIQERIKIALDIASAVNFLHRKLKTPTIHRDIKSANILLTGGDDHGRGITAKLCDFENLRHLPSGLPLNSQHDQLSRLYLLSTLGIPENQFECFSTINQATSISSFLATQPSKESFLPAVSMSYSCEPSGLQLTTGELGDLIHEETISETITEPIPSAPYASGLIGTLQWMAPEMFCRELYAKKSVDTEKSLVQSTSMSRSVLRDLQHLGSRTVRINIPKSQQNDLSMKSSIDKFDVPLKFYTEKVDIYSYGMLLWEIFIRTPPYLGVDAPLVAQLTCDRELRVPHGTTIPVIPSAIIASCLHPDPSKRPDMVTIIDCLVEWEKQIKKEGFGKEVVDAAKDMFSDVLSTFTGSSSSRR